MKLNRRRFELALAEKQLTKGRLAQLSGVAPSTITKLLWSEQEAHPITAGKLAKALGVDVTELLED